MREAVTRIKKAEKTCVLKSDVIPLGKLAWLFFGRELQGLLEDKRKLYSGLIELGLTCEEVADLEIREPYASEIAEYARMLGGGVDAVVRAVKTVASWHIQDIDRQIEMLQLRRRTLERKVAAVRHLAKALAEDNPPKSSI